MARRLLIAGNVIEFSSVGGYLWTNVFYVYYFAQMGNKAMKGSGSGVDKGIELGFARMISAWLGARTVMIFVSLGLTACTSLAERPPRQETTFISNALVIDGSGMPAKHASVRISGNRIEAVGRLTPRPNENVVDAAGLTLAPGFIDAHSHHDMGLADKPEALAAVSQGITTIVVGQDGSSILPLRALFSKFESAPAAVNLASFTGHGSLREQVLGDDFKREATPAEIESMKRSLNADMAAGSLGLSTGLEYDPGIYSARSEVLALAGEAGRSGGMYISHLRSEDRFLWEALDEIVAIGRQTGMPVQVSHMKLAMVDWWRQAGRFISKLEAARAEGIDITGDVYPYEYWQSTAAVLFPERNFNDRSVAEFALRSLVQPESLIVSEYQPDPSLVGKTLAEIARARNTDAASALMTLANGEAASIIATSMHPDDVAELIAWPHASICSDGTLDDRHPRGAGSFTRILRHYVRERGLLTLEAAIYKMTGLTASSLGLTDRGLIAPGKYADLILFDAQTVSDRATIDEPGATSAGIARVWTNGRLVYEDGRPTGARPGMVIRRKH